MDLGKTIIDTTENVRKVQSDFQKQTSLNNMFIVIASAVCVGIITKDTISDIMNEAILPLVLFFGKMSISYFVYTKALEKTANWPAINIILQKLGKLLWIVLIWLLVLYVVYILFKGLIKIDLVTGKIDLLQGVTSYVTRQEAPKHYISEEKKQNIVPGYLF